MALREEELVHLSDHVDLERDRALVERCQKGDSAAFGNLYARYYERLLRFCLRRLNDRHEAEDAAQEAFARAWKALPRFAGERRFYPWLTVIAGNVCTDVLRRRSRSTPTDDVELTARHPVGVVGDDTSEELVLAAVDGELVHRALDRLSTRHRHVLAMREESGWSYQQIADHEGVEVGTIETLLWRARQALKREFAIVADSKGALAGFLGAAGTVIRRSLLRAAHRGARVQHGAGGTGAVRNAVAGVAVTGAAVATAFIAPHAWSTGPGRSTPAPGAALAAPPLVPATLTAARGTVGPADAAPLGGGTDAGSVADPTAGVPGTATGTGTGGPEATQGGSSTVLGTGSLLGTLPGGSAGGAGLTGGLGQTAGTRGVNGTVSGVTSTVGQTASGATGTVGQTLSGVTSTVGQTASGATGTVGQTVSGATSGVNGLTQSVGLGNVLPGPAAAASPAGSGPSSGTTTTTTTNPVQGVVRGTSRTVGGLLGGN